MRIFKILLIFTIISFVICQDDANPEEDGKDQDVDVKDGKDGNTEEDGIGGDGGADEESEKSKDSGKIKEDGKDVGDEKGQDGENGKEDGKDEDGGNGQDDKEGENGKENGKGKEEGKDEVVEKGQDGEEDEKDKDDGNGNEDGKNKDDKKDEAFNQTLANDKCQDLARTVFICMNPTTKGKCILTNGKWKAFETGHCKKDLYCNEDYKRCTKKKFVASGGNIVCGSSGIFPDPMSCSKYHFCSADDAKPITVNCTTGTVYSATSRYCTKKLDSCKILSNKGKCVLGKLQPFPGNNNIYYMCVETKTESVLERKMIMFSCPDGEIFNDRTNMCSSDNETSSPNTECSSIGLHADPLNCRKYFYCNRQLKKEQHECPAGSHFKDTTQSCVRGKKCD